MINGDHFQDFCYITEKAYTFSIKLLLYL